MEIIETTTEEILNQDLLAIPLAPNNSGDIDKIYTIHEFKRLPVIERYEAVIESNCELCFYAFDPREPVNNACFTCSFSLNDAKDYNSTYYIPFFDWFLIFGTFVFTIFIVWFLKIMLYPKKK